MREVEQNMYN